LQRNLSDEPPVLGKIDTPFYLLLVAVTNGVRETDLVVCNDLVADEDHEMIPDSPNTILSGDLDMLGKAACTPPFLAASDMQVVYAETRLLVSTSWNRQAASDLASAEPSLIQESTDDDPLDELRARRAAAKWGLEYNREHKVMICVQCKTGIDPRYILSHLVWNHKFKKGEKHLQKILKVLELLPVHEVEVQVPDKAPIDPLAIYDGFRCLSCPYSSRSKETMQRHIREKQKPANPPEGHNSAKGYRDAQVQSFFIGLGRKWFPVVPDSKMRIDRGLITEEMRVNEKRKFNEFMRRATGGVVGEVIGDQVSPWLR
jgi:hypothetical protein